MRALLVFATLLWLPYGLFLVASPGFLREAAGVQAVTPTGTTELRAMYGGLQAGLGALAAAGLLAPALAPAAVAALGFLTAGLAISRSLGAALDGDLSAYTAAALGLEWGQAIVAALLLRRRAS